MDFLKARYKELPKASTSWAPSSNLGMIPRAFAPFPVNIERTQSPAYKQHKSGGKIEELKLWTYKTYVLYVAYLQQEWCCISLLITIRYQFSQYLKSKETEKINQLMNISPTISRKQNKYTLRNLSLIHPYNGWRSVMLFLGLAHHY